MTNNLRYFCGWHAPRLEEIPEGWWAECEALGARWYMVCPS